MGDRVPLPLDGKREITYDANGKLINPYIPRFISKAPWYSTNEDDQNTDYLSHQRQDPSKPIESHAEPRAGQGIIDDVETGAKRKLSLGPLFDKSIYKKVRVFPKDACTNCGSLNHLRKECLEKPRKISAKSLGIVIDEDKTRLKNVSDWDSKRDRWNGYDADKEWDNQVKHWKVKEENLLLLEKIESQIAKEEELDYDEEEAAELAELGLIEEKLPAVEKVINLMEKPDKLPVRSRDDKPVYLRNLGGEVTYNPKSRTDRSADIGYVDDNNQFVRHLNGELKEYERLQKFAWDANKNYQLDNKDLNHLDKHIEASPTLALLEMKKLQESKLQQRELKKLQLLAKYGEVSLVRPKFETKTDSDYKEYSKDGTLKLHKPVYDFTDVYNPKLGTESTTSTSSRYEEDVYPGNHKSVWGSFWKDGKWGYLCCKQLVKDSDCENNE